jgi:hypothetical protein
MNKLINTIMITGAGYILLHLYHAYKAGFFWTLQADVEAWAWGISHIVR